MLSEVRLQITYDFWHFFILNQEKITQARENYSGPFLSSSGLPTGLKPKWPMYGTWNQILKVSKLIKFKILLIFNIFKLASVELKTNRFRGLFVSSTGSMWCIIIRRYTVHTSLSNRCLILFVYFAAGGRSQIVRSPILFQPITMSLSKCLC